MATNPELYTFSSTADRSHHSPLGIYPDLFSDRNNAIGDRPIWYGEITPDMADVMLRKNDKNRNISKDVIDQYAGDMEDGAWRETMIPILLSTDGTLMDGQHRLRAIKRSGMAQMCFVCVVEDWSAMEAIDRGKKRTFGDYLKLKGKSSSTNLGGIISNYHKLIAFQRNDATRLNNLSIADLLATYESVDDEIWQEAVKASHKTDMFQLALRPSMPAFFVAACHQGDAEEAREFLNLVFSGENLSEGNPILTFRKSMMVLASERGRGGRSLRGRMMMVVKAWNAWIRGAELRQIKMNDQTFPKILKAL
jgi:hypothetical protein